MPKNAEHVQDSEDIFFGTPPDDVTSVMGGIITINKGKISLFLFLLLIFISSDVFIEKVLAGKNNTFAIARHTTTAGVVTQGMIIAFGYILISALVDHGYV